MSDHEHVRELLGVYALDALDPDEALLVELHTATCAACRDELDQHVETAGALGTVVESPPVTLWGRIESQLPATPASNVVSIAARRGAARGATWIAGAVAAATIVLLALGWSHANAHVARLQSAASRAGFENSRRVALRAPGHQQFELRDASGSRVADVVIAPSGTAYLSSAQMPALASTRTYQLWIIRGHQPVSIGLMGPHPVHVTFAVGPLTRGTTMAVTNEPAGGSVSPSSAPIASAVVRA